MRIHVRFSALLLLVPLLASCGDRDSQITLPVFEVTGAGATHGLGSAPPAKNFHAIARGDEEVPPRDTKARGTATFHYDADAGTLDYTLVTGNIDNVVQAHIHVGPAGENGPVVAFLFGPVPPAGGAFNGLLARGTITAADLIGPLLGQPLDALIEAMRAGGTYVNVHTSDGDATPNEGPGDFPGGEVRGQIDGAGKP